MVKYPKYIFTASMKNPLAWLLSIYITVLENCQLLVCIWIRCPLCDQEILSTVSKKWSFSPLHPTDKQMLPAIVTVAFRSFKNLSQKCCIFIQTCFISAEAWKILRKESSSRVDAPLAWTPQLPSSLPRRGGRQRAVLPLLAQGDFSVIQDFNTFNLRFCLHQPHLECFYGLLC